MTIITLLAVVLTAGSLFSSPRLRHVGTYSDKFFEQGIFTYSKDGFLFVKSFANIDYISYDTAMFQYSVDMDKLDTLLVHYKNERETLKKYQFPKHTILFIPILLLYK